MHSTALRIIIVAACFALVSGCAANTEEEGGEVKVTTEEGVLSPSSGPVCNYSGGQTLVVGRVMSPPRVTGCCTGYHAGGMGYYSCPTVKTQYLGCQDSAGNLSSWGTYAISGEGAYRTLPAGATTCSDPW